QYFARSADMRYVGQEYSVDVPIDAEVDLARVETAFHDAHRIRYGHSTPGAPVEFVNLRVAAFGRIAGEAAPFQPPEPDADPALGTRTAVFAGTPHETGVLLRDRFADTREGPVVVEEAGSTTVVPPGYAVDVDGHGNLLITRIS